MVLCAMKRAEKRRWRKPSGSRVLFCKVQPAKTFKVRAEAWGKEQRQLWIMEGMIPSRGDAKALVQVGILASLRDSPS